MMRSSRLLFLVGLFTCCVRSKLSRIEVNSGSGAELSPGQLKSPDKTSRWPALATTPRGKVLIRGKIIYNSCP